jgi:predicted metalloprotease with PDZ domain
MYSIEQRDVELLNTAARIRHHWHFDQAHKHRVRVVIEIDPSEYDQREKSPHASPYLVLGLPVWIPGSYKVRDYISMLGSFRVTDADGTMLAWHWISKNRFSVQHESRSVRVEYIYYAYERDSTIRSSHVTRNHAFINPVTCSLYVEGREQELQHIHLHYDRTVWKHCSTSLSPVSSVTSEGETLVLGALNYDILVDSPVEIGNHFTTKLDYINGDSSTSIVETAIVGRGNYDANWIAAQIETIVRTEAQMWGGLPFDRYVFIIHLFPGMRGGGLEHARSSVNALESGFGSGTNTWTDAAKLQNLLSLLCHEFFHVWNVKRIRPRELGPFDYNAENLTQMLWLVEGATSYYDDLLTYRCGFYTREEYFKVISKDHLTRFFRHPGRHEASIKDNSLQAWVKLYLPHDDSVNRNVSYYLHGGLIFWLLDVFIIIQSIGAKRLDDVFRELWAMYKARPHIGITEEEFIETAERSTGVAVRAWLMRWLEAGHSSKEELPFDELLEQVGLQWKPTVAKPASTFGEKLDAMKPAEKLFTGLTMKADGGRIIVTQVEDGSPAAIGGLAADDEIVFVNGARVISVDDVEFQFAKQGVESQSEIVIASDVVMVTMYLTPVEQPEYALSVNEAASGLQKRLLEVWLTREASIEKNG